MPRASRAKVEPPPFRADSWCYDLGIAPKGHIVDLAIRVQQGSEHQDILIKGLRMQTATGPWCRYIDGTTILLKPQWTPYCWRSIVIPPWRSEDEQRP